MYSINYINIPRAIVICFNSNLYSFFTNIIYINNYFLRWWKTSITDRYSCCVQIFRLIIRCSIELHNSWGTINCDIRTWNSVNNSISISISCCYCSNSSLILISTKVSKWCNNWWIIIYIRYINSNILGCRVIFCIYNSYCSGISSFSLIVRSWCKT